VLDYVAASQKTARPLELGGYDISMGGSASINELLPGLSAFLAARNSSLPKDPGWPSYRKLAAQVVALRPAPPPTDTELAAFRRVSARLDAELCGVQGDNAYTLQSAGFWCRIVKGVHAGHERQWTPNDTRDLAAGGNVQWLMANAFKGRKVVLWMHSCHAINGLQCGANRRNVGTLLSAAYGDQVYIAHFTSGRGPYNAYGDFGSSNPAAPPTLPPLASGMLEYYLAKAAKPAFMSYPADAAGRERLRGLSIFEPEFVAISPNHFGSGYGGLFFIPQAVAIVPDAASFPELPMAP
jgi:erythromycin esterase